MARSTERETNQLVLLAVGLVALLCTTTSLAAQRFSWTFHVYVDPIYGDDDEATALNPFPGGSPLPPLGNHPQATPTTGIQGRLQHAPYSFRTLSGTKGVGAYLRAITFLVGQPWDANLIPFRTLPWSTLPAGGSVDAVVIHCLPGIYGPFLPNDLIDQRSGLKVNGEEWPFDLDDGWSIQGTSALDTILDARGTTGPIIRVVPNPIESIWPVGRFTPAVLR